MSSRRCALLLLILLLRFTDCIRRGQRFDAAFVRLTLLTAKTNAHDYLNNNDHRKRTALGDETTGILNRQNGITSALRSTCIRADGGKSDVEAQIGDGGDACLDISVDGSLSVPDGTSDCGTRNSGDDNGDGNGDVVTADDSSKRIMIPYTVNYPVNHEDLRELNADERPEKAKEKLDQLGFFQALDKGQEVANTQRPAPQEATDSYSLTMSTLEPDSKVWECMKTTSMAQQIGTKQASKDAVTFQCPSRMDYESLRDQWIVGRARIHWFPRYFGKSLGELSEHIKMCDVILDVRDARIPYVADSDFLLNVYNNMFTHKPKVLVFTHADLAAIKGSEEWGTYYRIKNFWDAQQFNRNIPEQNRKPVTPVIFVDAKNGISCIVRLKKLIYKLCQRVNQRRARRGLAARPLRAIALGMPNVGKSALINRLLGRHKARSFNAAGVTRDIRLVRLHPQEYREAAHKIIDVIDTPGVLPANLYNMAFGPAKGKSDRKRNRLLGSMYFNLPQTYVHGGHSKTGIDAKQAPLERNVWLIAAANQIVEGAYDNDQAAENLLEQALDVYKRKRSYVELPRILKRIGLDYTPSILEMHPADFSHECLQTASHKHHGGDVNAAASRILADFRRGYYGRITLQTPPSEIPNRRCTYPEETSEDHTEAPSGPAKREYAPGIYEGW